jgi:hypothetical protein
VRRLIVAVLMPGEQLERLTKRTITDLRRLAPAQRDAVVEQILRSDPELGKVVPAMLSLYRSAKFQRRLGPLIRDSVM